MNQAASLGLRAVLAAILIVLFFAMAAAAAIGLAWGGWLLGAGALAHLRGRGLIFALLAAAACIGAAGVILWSLLPRFDRFEPPGPELSPGQ